MCAKKIILSQKCPLCSIDFEIIIKENIYIKNKYRKFCSNKCSNKYSANVNREKRIEKISKSIKEKINNGMKVGCVQINEKNIINLNCPICDKIFTTRQYNNIPHKKTCSNECGKILRIKTYNENTTKKVGGYRKGSGRGKSGWYKNYWCDSSYELAYVIFNIDHKINFLRNEKGFEYIWKNKIHTYYPDFIVNDTYVEIKGYETKQDLAKYNSIKNIIIYKKENLDEIIKYVKNKYGNDYIKLYQENPYNKLTNKCKVCNNSCKSKNTYCSRKCSGIGNNINSKYN